MKSRRRGVSVKIDGTATVHVDSNARFQDGTLHLELVRLLALGCNHFDLELDDVQSLDDAAVSDIVSWYHTLTYMKCELRLLNVSLDIMEKIEPTVAFAAIQREPKPYSPLKGTLRLLDVNPAADRPADTAPDRHSPAEDWGPLSAGYMSLGQWARMHRRQSH